MLSLKELVQVFNEKTRSYSELLPWFRPVTPGLVLCLDGSLIACFEYSGLDVESSDENSLSVAIESMGIAFKSFDDHNIIWTFLDKRRKQYQGESAISNEVARYVDQEWRNLVDHGNLGVVRQVIWVGFQPFGGQGGLFDEVSTRVVEKGESFARAFFGASAQRLSRQSSIERMEGKIVGAVAAFEKQLASFTNTLSARLAIERLGGNALITELANRCNLASPRSSVTLPDNDLYFLNTLLPVDTLFREAGGILRIEGASRKKFVSMHAVKGYPGIAQNGPIEALLGVRADFTLVQMFRFLDRSVVEKFIQDQEAFYRANIKGPIAQVMEKLTGVESERINLGMAALADDAQNALIEATAHNIGFGYHSMAVQVIADSREENSRSIQQIDAILSNAGYGLVKEGITAVSAFAVTIPGASDVVLRQTMVSTENLADLTILRTLSSGNPFNEHLSEQRGLPSESLVLLPTATDVPEFFNFHVGDVGHFFVIGPAGSGKSTFINFLILCWQRYAPCKTLVIDKGLSNYITLNSLGGDYIRIGESSDGAATMSPMRWIHSPDDHPKLRRWLELAMLAFDDRPLTVSDIQIIDKTLTILMMQTDGEKSLSSFHFSLNGQSKELANRLRPWVKGNRYGNLFDNPQDTFQLSGICGIDVGNLLSDEHLAPAVLGYMFEVIEESVDSTQPTFIYLEEAWYLLSNPAFRARFEDWIKTMRKRNAFVGIATQSLADIRKSPISSTLNDNIKTRVFLPNMQAFDSADVYRDMLGLRNDEIEVIRGARQKREYYIVQEGRRRLVDVMLPPQILALTRSDPKALAAYRAFLDSGDPDYLASYMEKIING